MRKIILIQPKVGSWEFIQEVPMVPLALLMISSYLTDEYDIRIIDQRLDSDWVSTLEQELKADVVCVGITTFTGPQISYGMEAAKIVKEKTNCPVVWGGIHPSILPRQTIQHPMVDILVEGEGEAAFRDLVHFIDKHAPGDSWRKMDYGHVPGVYVMKDDEPVGTLGVALDVNDLPDIPYDLVRVENYIQYDREGRRKFPIKTSRSCPYRCNFCHQTAKYRRIWRAATETRVVEEMKMLKDRYGIEHFQILDDNFFVNVKRATKIIESIADMKLDIHYTVNGARVSDILRLKEETVQLLAETGCYELQIGFESGSQKMLDHMKKDTKVSQIIETNELCKKYKIPRYYELLSGFQGEDREDLKLTAELILEMSKDDPDVFFSPIHLLQPYPGTEVYNQAEEGGMEFPDNLEDWAFYEWDKVNLPWLEKKQKKLLEGIHIFPTLISHKIKTFNSPFLQRLFRLYRPLARFRLKSFYFGLPFEAFIFKLMSRIREKGLFQFKTYGSSGKELYESKPPLC